MLTCTLSIIIKKVIHRRIRNNYLINKKTQEVSGHPVAVQKQIHATGALKYTLHTRLAHLKNSSTDEEPLKKECLRFKLMDI